MSVLSWSEGRRRTVAVACVALVCAQAEALTDVPPELKQIQAMTAWRMSTPDVGTAEDACGIRDAGSYEATRLDDEVGADVKDVMPRNSHA